MTLDITVELFTCLFSFVSGLGAGFLYDFFSVIVYKSGKAYEIVKDIFYFVVIGFISVNVIRYVNDGVFRIYELVFLIIGLLSYNFVLGRITRKALKLFTKLLYTSVNFLVKVLLSPLILVLKPLKRFFLKKYLQISKKICKNRLTIRQICFRIILYIANIRRLYKHK